MFKFKNVFLFQSLLPKCASQTPKRETTKTSCNVQSPQESSFAEINEETQDSTTTQEADDTTAYETLNTSATKDEGNKEDIHQRNETTFVCNDEQVTDCDETVLPDEKKDTNHMKQNSSDNSSSSSSSEGSSDESSDSEENISVNNSNREEDNVIATTQSVKTADYLSSTQYREQNNQDVSMNSSRGPDIDDDNMSDVCSVRQLSDYESEESSSEEDGSDNADDEEETPKPSVESDTILQQSQPEPPPDLLSSLQSELQVVRQEVLPDVQLNVQSNVQPNMLTDIQPVLQSDEQPLIPETNGDEKSDCSDDDAESSSDDSSDDDSASTSDDDSSDDDDDGDDDDDDDDANEAEHLIGSINNKGETVPAINEAATLDSNTVVAAHVTTTQNTVQENNDTGSSESDDDDDDSDDSSDDDEEDEDDDDASDSSEQSEIQPLLSSEDVTKVTESSSITQQPKLMEKSEKKLDSPELVEPYIQCVQVEEKNTALINSEVDNVPILEPMNTENILVNTMQYGTSEETNTNVDKITTQSNSSNIACVDNIPLNIPSAENVSPRENISPTEPPTPDGNITKLDNNKQENNNDILLDNTSTPLPLDNNPIVSTSAEVISSQNNSIHISNIIPHSKAMNDSNLLPSKTNKISASRRIVERGSKFSKINRSPPSGITALAPPHPTMSTLPIVAATASANLVPPVQKGALQPFTAETLDVRQLGLESPTSMNHPPTVIDSNYSDCAQAVNGSYINSGQANMANSPGMMSGHITSPASNNSYNVTNQSPGSNSNANFTLPNPSPSNTYMTNNSPNGSNYNIRQQSPSNSTYPIPSPSATANFTMPNPSPGNNCSMPTPSPTNSNHSLPMGPVSPTRACASAHLDNTASAYGMTNVNNQHVQQMSATVQHPPSLTTLQTDHGGFPMCSSAPPATIFHVPQGGNQRLTHPLQGNSCAMPMRPICPPGQGYQTKSSCSLTKLQQLTNIVGVGNNTAMDIADNTMTPPPNMSPPPLNPITNEHNIQQRNNMTSPAVHQSTVHQAASYKNYSRHSQHKPPPNVSITPNVTFPTNIASPNMLGYEMLNNYYAPQQQAAASAGYMNQFLNNQQFMMHAQPHAHFQHQMAQQRPQTPMHYGYMRTQHNMRR